MKKKVHGMMERDTNAMIMNAKERLPADVVNVLELFCFYLT